MKNKPLKIITIVIPSLLRRVHKAYALKALIRAQGCELHRIGRSRHWQLQANLEQIDQVINEINQHAEPSWFWLIKKLSNAKNNMTFEMIMNVAKRNPNITLNELVTKTHCTITDARRVLDQLEFNEEN